MEYITYFTDGSVKSPNNFNYRTKYHHKFTKNHFNDGIYGGWCTLIITISQRNTLHIKGLFTGIFETNNPADTEYYAAYQALLHAYNHDIKSIIIAHDYDALNLYKFNVKSKLKSANDYKFLFCKMLAGDFNIKFHKIKAHAGNKWNGIADNIARASIHKLYPLKNTVKYFDHIDDYVKYEVQYA